MEATVLIPTYNHVETLRYAVASVQAQTLQDFEILIVGDGLPEAIFAYSQLRQNRIRR